MKKAAIFDIDGTIFRSSLLIELTDALVQEGVFSVVAREMYVDAYKNWSDRKDTYEKYIGAVIEAFEQSIRGVKEADFSRVAGKVALFHQNRVYRYTRDLVKELKAKNYFLLAISNSPKIILEDFCQKFGFDKVYGRLYEVDGAEKFTGQTLFADIVADKAKVLSRAIEKENLTLDKSIGVGDSESDIKFLEMVEEPICFNPNQKLYDHAKQAGWKIVVERKDVIYEI